jgi:hypothetical protein
LEDGVASHFLSYLTGWKTMVIVRRNEDTHEDVKLDVIDFVMEYGREYDFVLKVRDHSVTTYIDGDLVKLVDLAGQSARPRETRRLGTQHGSSLP